MNRRISRVDAGKQAKSEQLAFLSAGSVTIKTGMTHVGFRERNPAVKSSGWPKSGWHERIESVERVGATGMFEFLLIGEQISDEFHGISYRNRRKRAADVNLGLASEG